MANFEPAYKKTGANEGLYSNDKADAGGETYKGIARNMHPHWIGWTIIDGYDKKSKDFLKKLEANVKLQKAHYDFYYKEFWLPIGGDKLTNQEVAEDLYDSGVNMGIGKSIQLMQRSLKLKETCKMDYATLEALNHVV